MKALNCQDLSLPWKLPLVREGREQPSASAPGKVFKTILASVSSSLQLKVTAGVEGTWAYRCTKLCWFSSHPSLPEVFLPPAAVSGREVIFHTVRAGACRRLYSVSDRGRSRLQACQVEKGC